jgi:hypothetical protein
MTYRKSGLCTKVSFSSVNLEAIEIYPVQIASEMDQQRRVVTLKRHGMDGWCKNGSALRGDDANKLCGLSLRALFVQ